MGGRTTAPQRTILISGASIAGPALAYWLRRYGFAVTIVEKAAALRGGGYPIDIRGTAVEVVRRMGLLPQLRDAHVGIRRLSFVDADGHPVAAVRPEDITGGEDGHDLEIPRGELAEILYGAIRDDVELLFNDSIATLNDHAGGVDVAFRGGTRRTFDLVIGADGIHSHTRSLAFGPEEDYHRYLDHCFAGFTMPNHLGLAHEGRTWNVPGRTAVLYAPRDDDRVHAFFSFLRPEPPLDSFRDPHAQRDLVAEVFAGYAWEVPRMVAAMRGSDDLFFDVVSQIHLPRWSTGRVALIGDAAYAPSFFSGQGSSLALAGAYVLAGELATGACHADAFGSYERTLRPFVERNQALATEGSAGLSPRTAEDLTRRNEALRDRSFAFSGASRSAHSALDLPDYQAV
ncbi:FAD-dependent monooxygenase [Streptomyces sp. S465]|uniref:FAD-dependent monooxygenase n=1 Tax=Streptomyces sp. S465 TaxID=2979468 RepID=UPI0022A87386|nr:FAD-dependent monooxygenase [Streptomyces sp. S465]WAP59679.1 FAD-dependent monooxygenase [Streptomyces sp. S465]